MVPHKTESYHTICPLRSEEQFLLALTFAVNHKWPYASEDKKGKKGKNLFQQCLYAHCPPISFSEMTLLLLMSSLTFISSNNNQALKKKVLLCPVLIKWGQARIQTYLLPGNFLGSFMGSCAYKWWPFYLKCNSCQ